MTKVIWKYLVESSKKFTITMPEDAQILDVQNQMGTPVMWALVNEDKPLSTRTFGTWGTGHSMPDDPLKYIGTFQVDKGMFIFHLFEYVRTEDA